MKATKRICVDRVLPRDLYRYQDTVRLRRGGPYRAISPIGKLWMNGSSLHVRFMGGTPAKHDKVKTQARWWSAHANLKFIFDNSPQADIRISFDSSDGAWSYIGTDAKSIPLSQPTMNLGFLDGGTAGHEFGHAIGLAHEHSSPKGGIQWNNEAVIKDLSGPPNNWSVDEIRHNVLDKYKVDQINGTEFDPDSIMLYFFPAIWTLNGVGTEQNEVLSSLDKTFVAGAKMYPKAMPGVNDKIPVLAIGTNKWKRASIGAPGEEDLFKFRISEGDRYVLATKGNSNVVMKLFGPNSVTNVLAEDDDSGTAQNARIIADLVPGEYFAQVRHSNRSNGVGTYAIGLRAS
jgi:hypothetical protein